jgi:hypothetical protein
MESLGASMNSGDPRTGEIRSHSGLVLAGSRRRMVRLQRPNNRSSSERLSNTNEQRQLTLVATFPQATYQMTNRATTLCLDLSDDNAANGTFIGGYNCSFGIPAQTWALQ